MLVGENIETKSSLRMIWLGFDQKVNTYVIFDDYDFKRFSMVLTNFPTIFDFFITAKVAVT